MATYPLDIFNSSGTPSGTATHGIVSVNTGGRQKDYLLDTYSPGDVSTTTLDDIWTTGNPTALEDRFDDPRYYSGDTPS